MSAHCLEREGLHDSDSVIARAFLQVSTASAREVGPSLSLIISELTPASGAQACVLPASEMESRGLAS